MVSTSSGGGRAFSGDGDGDGDDVFLTWWRESVQRWSVKSPRREVNGRRSGPSLWSCIWRMKFMREMLTD